MNGFLLKYVGCGTLKISQGSFQLDVVHFINYIKIGFGLRLRAAEESGKKMICVGDENSHCVHYKRLRIPFPISFIKANNPDLYTF